MKRTPLALLSFIVLVSAPGTAHASMIGDTITVNRLYPNLGTIFGDPPIPGAGLGTVTTTVGPGLESASPQPTLYSIDLGSNSIVFDFLATSAFGGAAVGVFDGLQFLGFSQDIGNVSASATGINVAGLDFVSRSINLDLDGVFNPDSLLTLQVDFAAPAAVPEPGTLLLFATSALGLWAARTRRRR